MRKIFEGKIYDTATAIEVAVWRNARFTERKSLYRTPRGNYFGVEHNDVDGWEIHIFPGLLPKVWCGECPDGWVNARYPDAPVGVDNGKWTAFCWAQENFSADQVEEEFRDLIEAA